MARRVRCHQHNDQMTEHGACPKCRIEELEQELARRDEAKRRLEGEPVRLCIGKTSYATVLRTVLGTLGYRKINIYIDPEKPGEKMVRIGGKSNFGTEWVYRIPSGLVKALIQIIDGTSKEMEIMATQVASITAERISSVISDKIVSKLDLDKAKKKGVKTAKEWLATPITGPEFLTEGKEPGQEE